MLVPDGAATPRILLRLLLALAAAFWSASCAEVNQSSSSDEDALIADVGGLDEISQMRVEGLLAAHGIGCHLEGSIAYGLFVRKLDAARAIALIRDDVRRHRYPISLSGSESYSVADSDWTAVSPGQKYTDLIQREPYRQGTDVGGVLRDPKIASDVRAFPYVRRIMLLERQCFDSRGLELSGHDVRIELEVRPDQEIGGAQYFYQAWDNGHEIRSQGSSEWWSGDPDKVMVNQKRYDHRGNQPTSDANCFPRHNCLECGNESASLGAGIRPRSLHSAADTSG